MRGVILLLTVTLLILLMRYGAAAEGELGDIVSKRKTIAADDIPPAIFPHWVHRMRFKCHVCHEAIFPMTAGAAPVTMDAIREGKFCGTCHDGTIAFPVGFDTCDRCHRQ
jgi:c(7)-type cytochrome triheme protein